MAAVEFAASLGLAGQDPVAPRCVAAVGAGLPGQVPQVVQRGGQAGPLGLAGGDLPLEDPPAARAVQGVTLQLRILGVG